VVGEGKRKVIPVHAVGVQEVEASKIARQSAQEGGKVVSPAHRPPLLSREVPWYSFLLEAESTPSAAGRIKSLKNSSDSIGNRTRDLPACSAVPPPAASSRTSTEVGCCDIKDQFLRIHSSISLLFL
jgi:hypothetical protein